MKDLWRRKIKDPIFNLLKQGLTPLELARALSLGAVIGIIPLLGVTVILCALLAKILRLNPLAIQVTNYAVYPLQFILLIPFFRLGEKIYGAPEIPLNLTQMTELLSHQPKQFFAQFLMTGIHGFTAWFLCSLPLFFFLKYILHALLVKRMKTQHG